MTEEQNNTRQVMSVRLPKDLHEWLRRASFDARRPMGAIVIQALDELRERTKVREVSPSGKVTRAPLDEV